MKYKKSSSLLQIYVITINDEAHRGIVKVGMTSYDGDEDITELKPNCKELNQSAKNRIRQYTQTAAVDFTLHHTELAISLHNGVTIFDDDTVRDVLYRSGIKRHIFNIEFEGDEWCECDVETAINAIKAVKEGRNCLFAEEVVKIQPTIKFRPEQDAAIKQTVKKFRTGKKMLWYAKMRFGKTLCALQVAKTCQYKRTIIITHRPVVDEGWFDDFKKIFRKHDKFAYGSRNKGEHFETLEQNARKLSDYRYIYFASLQDLRGSEKVGGKFDKNEAIFAAEWDLLIVDECHEGTQTQLGQNVIELLTKENTHVLDLSGTPFNRLDEYNNDEIYTWDYVMEQKAKAEWDINHFGDHNPYADLPRMNIYTFDLGKLIANYTDIEDSAFNFKEFFRTWTGELKRDHRPMPSTAAIGDFIHEEDVRRFLDLMVKYDPQSNYPFSTAEYRNNFRHSLWMVPGVKEARALSAMLKSHPVFGKFTEIVNVAGEGDEDVENEEALTMVKNAMGDDPEQTYTITLSCGRLTTGVTVRPWTAVMMLAGSSQTDAKAYMQTIFRVQSPCHYKSGRVKQECFVFDFAPDRTLKVIANTAKISAKAGKSTSDDDRATMGEFLNFCPIIGYNGTSMKPYNVDGMLEQLKKIYIDHVVKNGFEDSYLYNNDLLLQLTDGDLAKFSELHKIIGSTKANHTSNGVDINNQGLTNEQYDEAEKLKKKKKKDLTEEEKAKLEEYKEKKKNRDSAISILRGISIRFPLLIYGAELPDDSQDVSIENFAELIDDSSWQEFMPRGVTKERFADFVQFYDPDVFRAAGRKIRTMALAADSLTPLERTKQIARIFSFFRNPDKETVLTPWRVVNMHMSDCLGGYDFYDESHTETLSEPRFVDRGEVTTNVFASPETHILEINSKTGLYPLYVTYSVFEEACKCYREKHNLTTDIPEDVQLRIWDEVVAKNVFVVCKTPMAKSITKRTLMGFRKGKVNAHYFEDLINKIQNQPKLFIDKMSQGMGYWKANKDNNMKFNAIVGNPPYMIMDGGNKASATPIYNLFVDIAKKCDPMHISMIMPAKWYSGGKGLDSFRTEMLNDSRVEKLIDYTNSTDCFPTADIAGGVCYFLWSRDYEGLCTFINTLNGKESRIEKKLNELEIFVRYPVANEIVNKVRSTEKHFMNEQISARKPFGLATDVKPIEGKGDIKLRYNGGYGDFKRSSVITGTDKIDKWKVMISYLSAEHAGQPDKNGMFKVLSTMEILPPQWVCTETYLLAGCFENKENALNLLGYLKTRFVRFLIGQVAIGQHITRMSFIFVPQQDFSKPWTDEMLYKKYNLSKDEIAYIESMIKPME
ncbi:MAG: Eco57I restriction-modification methylase domain-containing protein [Bacteroidales bacterium]|nr:Eco57I restriction-modification methylase domain-containing protein [Bacteroidales bacterium]